MGLRPTPETLSGELLAGAAALLEAAGLGRPRAVAALPGGANNRVFAVEHAAGKALLKAYFRDPADPRDRLGAEFAFCSFAWDGGLRALPRPLAKDERLGLGLYEFIAGRPCGPDDATPEAVLQAADFFRALNALRGKPSARALPEASDACLSPAEHLRLAERKVKALLDLPAGGGGAGAEAGELARSGLAPAWERVSRRAAKDLEALGGERPLPGEKRRLSPSDFGFHNALLREGGRLAFLDFEYAGWDDPAKMAADFFSQVAVPVPEGLLESFLDRAFEGDPDLPGLRRRLDWALPLHRVKWACLLLNEFLPAGGRRRRFAGEADIEERGARQLEKARAALGRIP